MVRRMSQPTYVSSLRRPGIAVVWLHLMEVFDSYGGGTCHDNTVEEYFYSKHFNSHYATGLKETQGYNTELVITSTEQECAKASLKDEARNAFYFVSPALCYLVNIRNEPMVDTGLWVAWASSVLGSGTEYPCHPSNAIDQWVSLVVWLSFSALTVLSAFIRIQWTLCLVLLLTTVCCFQVRRGLTMIGLFWILLFP